MDIVDDTTSNPTASPTIPNSGRAIFANFFNWSLVDCFKPGLAAVDILRNCDKLLLLVGEMRQQLDGNLEYARDMPSRRCGVR